MPGATKPFVLTKPKSGETDGSFETIGTSKGFLTAWSRSAGGLETELLFQRFDTNGKAIGREITLKDPMFGLRGPHDLVDLGRNKVGLLYTELDKLKSVVIDTVTGKVGKPVDVIASQHSSLVNDMTMLPNGRVALVTRDFVDFSREDTILVMLDNTMKPIGQPKIVEQDKLNPFGAGNYQQTIVQNGKGGLTLYLNGDNEVEARAFSATGALSKPFTVSTTEMRPLSFLSGIIDFEVQAETLETGGVAVTWQALDPDQDLNFDIYTRVVGENGKPIGRDIKVNIDSIGNQDAPEILSFKQGYGVAWTDKDGFNFTQTVRFFDKSGKAVSDEIATEYFGLDGTVKGFPSDDNEFAQLSDGSYVKVFGAEGKLYGDAIPAPKFGTTRADALAGKQGSDILLGAAGNDRISAVAGSDALDGGAGNDTLDGGTGSDLLIGAAGNDILMGGAGADVFAFRPGAGRDTIRDFKADDRIDVSAFHFNQQKDALELGKQSGKDVVFTFVNTDETGSDTNVVRLTNVKLATLTESDFII